MSFEFLVFNFEVPDAVQASSEFPTFRRLQIPVENFNMLTTVHHMPLFTRE